MLNLRRAAAASTLLLLAPLSACGGDDDASSAPESASTDDFCTAYNSLYESLMQASPSAGEEQDAAVQALREWTERMRDTGTPEEMPDDARRGYELVLDTADDIDENSSMEDLESLGDDLTEEEQADAEAFSAWAQEECPMDAPGLPTEAPTEAPTEGESETTAP